MVAALSVIWPLNPVTHWVFCAPAPNSGSPSGIIFPSPGVCLQAIFSGMACSVDFVFEDLCSTRLGVQSELTHFPLQAVGMLLPVVSRIIPHKKDVHVPIPRTCEFLRLYNILGCPPAGLDLGDDPRFPGWAQCHHRGLENRRDG